MARFNIVKAKLEHVDFVAKNIRAEDAAEVKAVSYLSPGEALEMSFFVSDPCHTILYKDEPVGCFGVAPMGEGKGSPWLLATDRIKDMPMYFIRSSKQYIENMLKEYKFLENWVALDNTISIKWLKWVGFKIEEPEVYGLNGELFCRFWLRRE